MKRFVSMWLSAFFLLSSAEASNALDIDLDKLFWAERDVAVQKDLYLLASYREQNREFYMLKSASTQELKLIEKGNEFLISGQVHRFHAYNKGGLLLLNASNEVVRIAYLNGSTKPEAMLVTPNKLAKEKSKKRSSMAFSGETFDLEEIKNISRAFGVPSGLVDSIDRVPSIARSGAGRPGWKLGDEFPSPFFTFSPFEVNDIILTIDGISTHDLSVLPAHVLTKGSNARFIVELERAGKLKLMEVSSK